MPKTTTPAPRLRLHRETLRRLTADAGLLLTDQPLTGDTALCGPSRQSLCDSNGCTSA
jgi:hypothetical protein